MRLLTAISIASLVVSIASVVLVLMLFVTEPWTEDESTPTETSIVLTEPTPTPFVHKPLLSSRQVGGIMKKYGKIAESSDGFGCLYNAFVAGLHSEVVWWYMDDNSDRWMVTATGNECRGIKIWFVDDNTGEVHPSE